MIRTRVDEWWDRVVICGQGPSWLDVEWSQVWEASNRGAAVIAVNGAIDQLHSKATHWFTLDHSLENQERMANPVVGPTYYAAVPDDFEERFQTWPHVRYLRRVVRHEPKDGRPFEERVKEQIVGGLAEDPGEIYTGNSGFGALGLAYHMGPSRVLLLGIDGAGLQRWDGSANRSLDHLPELFAGAVPQLEEAGVQVMNGSPGSAVECFPRLDSLDGLRWLVG